MEYKNYRRCNGLHLGDKSQNRELAVWKLTSIDRLFQLYKMCNTMLVNAIRVTAIFKSMALLQEKKKTYGMLSRVNVDICC